MGLGLVGDHFVTVTLFTCICSSFCYRRSQNKNRSHQLLCEEATWGPALHHEIHRVWKSSRSRGICAAGSECWGATSSPHPLCPLPPQQSVHEPGEGWGQALL